MSKFVKGLPGKLDSFFRTRCSFFFSDVWLMWV